MAEVKDDLAQLDATLREGEREIARAYREEMRAIREDTPDETIDTIAQTGIVQPEESDGRKTAAAILALFLLAGLRTTATIEAQVTTRLAFDQAGFRVAGWLQRAKDRVNTALVETQTAATRAAVADALARNATGEQMRRAIRQSIGLTERQVQAGIVYRKALESFGTTPGTGTVVEQFPGVVDLVGNAKTVREAKDAARRALRSKATSQAAKDAIVAETPIPAKEIDKLVEAFLESKLNLRAKVLGETQAINAVNEGATEAWDQAADAGAVPPTGANRGNMAGQTEETWQTALDERVRDSHRRLQGVKRPDTGYWQGSNGQLRFPGDPSAPLSETAGCRCFIRRSATV